MSRKSALEFVPTSFARSSALMSPCTRWSATPSLAATYMACVGLYPCIMLKSSCLGGFVFRGYVCFFCFVKLGARGFPEAVFFLYHIFNLLNHKDYRRCLFAIG